MDPSDKDAIRTSSSGSGSGRPSRDGRKNSQQSLSLIEKSVTHLLVATKQLLETLTQWSRRQATEGEVSDIYVRLGYEFNIACRNFAAIGVDTSDLGPVPDLLRGILEETLSQEASQASLEKFLPRIRDIIINLLQGLKRKQQKLRLKSGKDGSTSGTTRQSSVGSNGSAEESLLRQSSTPVSAQRQDSADWQAPEGAGLPPRTSSQNSRSSPTRRESVVTTAEPEQYSYSTQSSLSGNVVQDYPIISPYTPSEQSSTEPQAQPTPAPQPSPGPNSFLQPKQQDALAALQRGGDLERRASRRFSAYQIQKHLGSTSPGISMIPPTQTSPIPNRGRDTRETMNAVRVRGTPGSMRDRPRRAGTNDQSPNRQKSFPEGIPEEKDVTSSAPLLGPLPEYPPLDDSPTMKTPEDKLAQPQPPWSNQQLPPSDNRDIQKATSDALGATAATVEPIAVPSTQGLASDDTPKATPLVGTSSSSTNTSQRGSSGKELTLFLQYKTKIKKFVLADGYDELSVARLQLAFIEKFAWNVHSNNADLPDIYIQDPLSGVRYELEDLSDVKNNSVLALNVDSVDEVKRHFDDSLGSLRSVVEGVKTAVDGQQSTIQRISDKQIDISKEVARASSVSSTRKPPEIFVNGERGFLRNSNSQLSEVQSLRRDLAVMRQTYQNLMADMQKSMSKVREKAAAVKTAAADATDLGGDSGRGYVNAGKKTLSDDSEKIINRVDDLQDLVEDLRKDVVTRGVRPLPRQLETVSKEITTATSELKRLQGFIKREKPTWTKIWKNELQVVCDDQNLLTMQEELAADLEDDLEKAAQTFALVEQATKQQNLQQNNGAPGPAALRSTSRTLANASDVDPQKAKDGVLGEVRALQPNHDTRLEAIERSERARQRELQDRGEGAFKKELGNFVDERKLKKSGGVEEAERLRKNKDEAIRKGIWEKVSSRSASREPDPDKQSGEGEAAPSVASSMAALSAGMDDGDASVPAKLDIPSKTSGEGPPSAEEFVEAPEQIDGLGTTLS